MRGAAVLFLLLIGCSPSPVRVGSKKFTESVILAELCTLMLRSESIQATHERELGGSRILFEALQHDEIDVYVEYTGTLIEELIPNAQRGNPAALVEALAARGIKMTRPLGFNNTYAIGVRDEVAERLGLRTISDLRQHPGLRFGFSNEFMQRKDGWHALQARYELRPQNLSGLDHDLAYRAIESGQLDVVDLYSTDAEIEALRLRVLVDDLEQFPEYAAVVLYRSELTNRGAKAIAVLQKLEGAINGDKMIGMNARAKTDRLSEASIAADFMRSAFGRLVEQRDESRYQRIWVSTREHLALVSVSLLAAIGLGVPLGIIAARRKRVGHAIIAFVNMLQTIPSLALLVALIPLVGIGSAPAVIALFLYSLLPIVRGTHSGVVGVPADLQDSAGALGLPSFFRLWRIELPLASPSILAGIKVSAVMNIGTATLGALVGAGGYGQPILSGIRLADTSLILEGALPASLLALITQALFERLETFIVPRGLRVRRGEPH